MKYRYILEGVMHTPGEWVALAPSRIGKHWHVGTKIEGGSGRVYIVAAIHNGAPGDTLDTEEANARLFAASKDLLAACKEFVASEVDCDQREMSYCRVHDRRREDQFCSIGNTLVRMRAAIAAATGVVEQARRVAGCGDDTNVEVNR